MSKENLIISLTVINVLILVLTIAITQFTNHKECGFELVTSKIGHHINYTKTQITRSKRNEETPENNLDVKKPVKPFQFKGIQLFSDVTSKITKRGRSMVAKCRELVNGVINPQKKNKVQEPELIIPEVQNHHEHKPDPNNPYDG